MEGKIYSPVERAKKVLTSAIARRSSSKLGKEYLNSVTCK